MNKLTLALITFFISLSISAQKSVDYRIPVKEQWTKERINKKWSPKSQNVVTSWGKKVTSDNVWKEYPRPQMVREEWRNLNGLWDLAVTDVSVEAPQTYNRKILVPFSIEAPLSGIGEQVSEKQAIWYHRKIEVPGDWKGKRVLLHIEASDWETTVWVNGEKAGMHLGGYDPFNFDITDQLAETKEQEIVIRVWDPGLTEYKSQGKQKNAPDQYELCSGIWQSVWMEPVPLSYIQKVKMTPDVDKGQLIVEANVSLKSTDKKLSVEISGAEVIEQSATRVVMQFHQPKLWSPKNPHLYPVKLSWGDDKVNSYVGLRKIERKEIDGIQRICLNGEPIFQFGPLDQNYWPQGGLTPPSEEAMKWELDYLKEIGCNMVRLHIKRNPRKWYTYCDQLGLLIWQDFINGGKGANGKGKPNPVESKRWKLEQQRMVDALYNHPSIVMWIVFNEAWGQHDTKRNGQWATDYDSSRLISIVSGWTDLQDFGDIRDIHDYTFHTSILVSSEPKRAVVIGEYGGINSVMVGHNWYDMGGANPQKEITPMNGRGGGMWPNFVKDDEWVEEYKRPTYTPGKALAEHLEAQINDLCLLKEQGLCAAVYTQLTDMKHEQNGWLSFDRISKVKPEALKKIHKKLYESDLNTKSLLSDESWSYSSEKPQKNNWRTEEFNTEAWEKGAAPFGKMKGKEVGTAWETKELFMRKAFDLAQIPKKIALKVYLDGQFVNEFNYGRVYLNGTLVHDGLARHRKAENRLSCIMLRESSIQLLKHGINVIAVEVVIYPESQRRFDIDLVSVFEK